MFGFEDDRDSERVEFIHEKVAHLICDALLILKASRKCLQRTRKLAQADDPLVRDVRNVPVTEKGAR